MSRVLEDTLVRFERRLPGDRRHQVLRAGRDQGRGRLPQPARQPVRPGLLRPGRQLAAARDRQHQPGPARRPRQHDRAADLGGRRTGRGGAGAGRGRDQGGLPLPRDGREPERTGRARRAGRRGARGDAAARAATWKRSRPSARSRPKGGSRTSRSWSACAAEFDVNREREGESEVPPLEEFLQQISLYTEQDGLTRRRVAGHADDPPQRQGPGVRHGLHRRLRGGRLPAHARPRRGRRGGGAAPLLRRHHPRPAAPLHDLGARAAAVRARRAQPALALRRRAAGRADRAPRRLEPAARAAGTRPPRPARRSRSTPGRPWSCAPATTSSTPASATASSPRVEPGGVVVVRFAGDGTERKLMADYAPIRKR